MVMPLMELAVIFRMDLHCDLQFHLRAMTTRYTFQKLNKNGKKLSSTDIQVSPCDTPCGSREPLAAGKVCGGAADSAQINSESKGDKYISLVYI